MENLIFSLNATVPVFLMMVLGLVFRKLGWIDDVFASKMNKFVFLVPLPVLVFEDLATVDFSEVWDLKFVLFCFAATLISIGIAAGILWSALKIPMPPILEKTVSNVGAVATPLGLMAMGATFDIRKAFAKVRPAAAAAVMKLVGFAAVFLPLAVMLGFRREELVAILVMLGSATTVSCFVMAKNMGHEGVLTSSVVMLTTLFSAFTLTGWLYVLRSLGMV